MTAQSPARKDAYGLEIKTLASEAKAKENKGKKSKTEPGAFVPSTPALRARALSKGLALSFLAAKAKRKATMIDMV